jgi:predicted ATPase
LELAAARIRSLSIEQINARLHDRFKLLTGGTRTSLPRQQAFRKCSIFSRVISAAT